MLKRIIAIGFIFIMTAIAWSILGANLFIRSNESDQSLTQAVGDLWGRPLEQTAPQVYWEEKSTKTVVEAVDGKNVSRTQTETERHPVNLAGSTVDVRFKLEHRQKGLMWYPTYSLWYDATYTILNDTGEPRTLRFHYTFPSSSAAYDDFTFQVGDKMRADMTVEGSQMVEDLALAPGAAQVIRVKYKTQGMKTWMYNLGEGVKQVRNFRLTAHTDFDNVDFPATGVSPTQKSQTNGGWKLTWAYTNLLADINVGLVMPQKLNPGPWVAKVTFFAPISLFLFFFVLFIITVIRKVNIHPMNYFFIGASFFSFHLLLAYLVDHISVEWAMLICSVVSIALTVSYMRLVAGNTFAWREVGLSQFVYLVLFSYTFFLEHYVGLAVTILSILTLFVVMQMTGRINWDEVFTKPKTTSG
ncbi:MAG: inner membrane CreD family protein [Bacteroidetes Order II. Incertae sedis bacterium]|nr:inner membrane CreD family protein [Bacteroidetes Order II. bacterium]